MFNWQLLAVLIGICVPGIALVVPRAVDAVSKSFEGRESGRPLPPRAVFITAQFIQALVLAGLLGAGGVFAARHTGLGAPFFEALVTGGALGAEAARQALPAVGLGAAGAALFLFAYYWVFRPRLDAPTVQAMERLRMQSGLLGRMLYGGIVEEVLCRWGCMNLILWGLSAIWGGVTPLGVWLAIVLSGILFGLGHIPSYRQAGCRSSAWFLATEIVLNLGAALVFGWLFAHVGLLAAMIAHATYHVLWYPFDRVLAARSERAAIDIHAMDPMEKQPD